MKARLEDKNRAIELRRTGLSYREIQKTIPVSKGLLSGWFKGIVLTENEKNILQTSAAERLRRNRMRALINNQSRRIERERLLGKEAERLFMKHRRNPLFLTGITLYWAHGSILSTGFSFINADPDMIFIMNKWVRYFLSVPKEKIKITVYSHKIPGYDTFLDFWVKNLDLEPQNCKQVEYATPIKSLKKRNPFYKGSVKLFVTRIRYERLMKAWQKLFIQYYGEAFIRS